MEARTFPETGRPATLPGRITERVLRRAPARAELPQAQAGSFASACIAACEGDTYSMDNGRHARAALSCLVKPETGDLVQLFHTGAQCFITAILHRAAFERADTTERRIDIAVGGADTLQLNVRKLACVADESISLCAGQSCEIASPGGRVMLTARNLFTIASDNLVQQARTSLTQALNYSVKALELLHLKGRQQLISAETEIRLDGQYINMG
jgi:hypothetical protein